MTTIKRCSCTHKYQDKRYGKNRRVHNSKDKDRSSTKWRCTVCGDEK